MSTRIRFATWAAVAGSIAVVLAGVVAIIVVERSLHQVVDERVAATLARIQASSSVEDGCDRIATLADDPRGRVASLVRGGVEACRSSPAAPSPRALGIDLASGGNQRARSRSVDGISWRVGTAPLSSMDGFVIVGEQDESVDRALRNAQRAIVVAISIGILLAIAAGVVAAGPATRRIRRLLERIRRAAGRRGAAEPVAGGLGRDLDRAGASIDELLTRLRESEASRHRLFADAAHQLRTPVTSIRTNAQLLERREDIDADARDMAARIATQSAAIGTLVSSLVDYAAVEAWGDAGAERHSLGGLAREAVERAVARWPDVDIALEADDSSASVDGELVIRAIGNVLDNAIVHGSAPIEVTVDSRVITIVDAGDGFVGIDSARAFEPFASGDGGTGLGLAFVAHVARAHGGTVRLEDGPGTRVVLELIDRTDTLG